MRLPLADLNVFLDEPQLDGPPRRMLLVHFYRQFRAGAQAGMAEREAIAFAEYLLDHQEQFNEALQAAHSLEEQPRQR
jgi:hypothetical protein